MESFLKTLVAKHPFNAMQLLQSALLSPQCKVFMEGNYLHNYVQSVFNVVCSEPNLVCVGGHPCRDTVSISIGQQMRCLGLSWRLSRERRQDLCDRKR